MHRPTSDWMETRDGSMPPRASGYAILRPDVLPTLRAAVVELIGFEERGAGYSRQLKPARLCVPLVFVLRDGFRVSSRAPPASQRPDDIAMAQATPRGAAPAIALDREGFLAGVTTAGVAIESNGESACLQVNLSPWAARTLLRADLHELTDERVPLSALELPGLQVLLRRLGDTPSWPERFALVQSFLAAHIDGTRASSPVMRAVAEVARRHGDVRVEALAATIGWSRKHLATRFREELGITPKQVLRLVRFHRALALARYSPCPRWCDIAAACGYADQAHLSREFSAFAGETPSAWQARLQPTCYADLIAPT
jgi:AraC-like DNA-binding protein